MSEKTVLFLTLHCEHFEDMANGLKDEDYRLDSPFWRKRLEGRKYDEVHMRNGYRKDAPFMRREFLDCVKGNVPWRENWAGREYQSLKPGYIIKLGEILELRNWPPKEER